MFRFDLSSLSESSCRSLPLQHEYEAIKNPSMLAVRPCLSMPDRCLQEEEQKELKQLDFDAMKDSSDDVKKVKQVNPPSPARTASTQCSSNCSVNNSGMSMEISRDSIDLQSTSSSPYSTDSIKLQFSPQKGDQEEQKPSTNNGKGSKGIKRSNSFSKILKSLRKNISLVTSASFDSGLSKLSKRGRKKKGNSTFSSVDVDVRVIEGEGVEVITNFSEESSDSSNCSSSDTDSDEFSVPKIIRDTSTFATTSMTSSGSSTEIYQQESEVQRLCNLMHRLINSEDEDDINLENSSSEPVRIQKNGNQHLREEESELGIEVLSISSVSAERESIGFSDIMMFVNNEQTVLEYSCDELQLFD